MTKLYISAALFFSCLSSNNDAFSSNLVRRWIPSMEELENISKNSLKYPIKIEKIIKVDFEKGEVYRRITEPFFREEDINKISKCLPELPLEFPIDQKIESLDFDKDTVRFKY